MGSALPSLFLVRDRLCSKELFDTPIAIEATKSTCLSSAMWERPFVMDCHRIDVDSTVTLLATG